MCPTTERNFVPQCMRNAEAMIRFSRVRVSLNVYIFLSSSHRFQ